MPSSAKRKECMRNWRLIHSIRKILILTTIAAISGLTGCSTISRGELRKDSGYKDWYYPATKRSSHMIYEEPCNWYLGPCGFFVLPFLVVDFAFSISFETLFLPIDYIDGNYWRSYLRPKCPPKKQPKKDLTPEELQILREADLLREKTQADLTLEDRRKLRDAYLLKL